MLRGFRIRTAPVALVALVALLGCADEATDPGGDVLPDELALALGGVIGGEVEASLNALTVPTAVAPLGVGTGEPCASPSSTADTDGDGVYDDATFTFTAPPCRFTGFRGGTLDIVGELRIEDPVPASAGFGYVGTYTGLRTTFTGEKTEYSVTRNGSTLVTGSTGSLTLTTDLQVTRTFTGKPDAAVDRRWTVTFTPAEPLQINRPLPSGSLDLTGTLVWDRGDEHLGLTITTSSPLVYDAGCTDTPQRIRAGELRAAGSFDDTQGYLRLRWSDCGEEPNVQFIAEE